MGSLSNYLELELLDHVFNASYTPVATVYLALFESDPTDAFSGTETAYTSYARQPIAFDAAASRSVVQTALETFPANTGSTVTITHWGIFDALTVGNGLAHGAFGASKQVNNGNTPSVAAAEVTVDFSAGEISNYLANIMLDFAFRNQTFTQPATWIALIDATASDSDTGSTISEPSGGAYARVQVDVNGGSPPTWKVAAAGLVQNNELIQMPTPTASWGTIVGVAICDASTAGNLLGYDNTMGDEAIGIDDDVEFPVDALDITLD
jgi:hypothetical protein